MPPNILSGRCRSARHLPAWPLRASVSVALLVSLFLSACGDSAGPDDGGGDASLAGTVRAAGSAAPLADARVSVGTRSATSDVNGHFEITDVAAGAATVRASRPGYEDVQLQLQIVRGTNSHDFSLSVKEVYKIGANAALVPSGAGPIRAVIVALGGPDVSGFVTGERIVPPNRPAALESTLQSLGADLRSIARTERVALFGSSKTGMPSSAASDAEIFAALGAFASSSGRPELATAPVLLIGISGGGREASGLVSRNPGRSIGLFLRVPASVTELNAAEALAVPTFILQGGNDTDVDNFAVQLDFLTNRSRHGLWALAVEPGVTHQTPTTEGNTGQMEFIREALSLRLPAAPSEPLVPLDEASGWLGNQTTLEAVPWPEFTVDKLKASWLLSAGFATVWKDLGTENGGGGGGGDN